MTLLLDNDRVADFPLEHPPPGGWTVDDLDKLPESHVRYELTDGALTVSPSPTPIHQYVAGALMYLLAQACPDDLAVTQAVDVVFNPQLTRIPDIQVVRRKSFGQKRFAADEIVVAVELESPGSHVSDRATKPYIYGRYGVPHYWRFEFDPFTLVRYERMDDGTYKEMVRSTEELNIAEPFPFRVALADLLPPWEW